MTCDVLVLEVRELVTDLAQLAGADAVNANGKKTSSTFLSAPERDSVTSWLFWSLRVKSGASGPTSTDIAVSHGERAGTRPAPWRHVTPRFGRSGQPPLAAQRERVLASWDGFLAAAGAADLDRPSLSRCRAGAGTTWSCTWATGRASPRWTGCWPRRGPRPRRPRIDPDGANAAVVAAHRDASRQDVLAPLSGPRPDRGLVRRAWMRPTGRCAAGATVMSVVGPLLAAQRRNAAAYELAVYGALDLGVRPGDALLDAGLAALVDVTGVFASRRGLRASLTAWTGRTGWQVRTGPDGWSTAAVLERPPGAAVEGDAAVLLDASAGRRAVPALLASRTMRVHGLPDIVRLAPIVDEVPVSPAVRPSRRRPAGSAAPAASCASAADEPTARQRPIRNRRYVRVGPGRRAAGYAAGSSAWGGWTWG